MAFQPGQFINARQQHRPQTAKKEAAKEHKIAPTGENRCKPYDEAVVHAPAVYCNTSVHGSHDAANNEMLFTVPCATNDDNITNYYDLL